MCHQTQDSSDRNHRSLHQMLHPASHTWGREQEETQAICCHWRWEHTSLKVCCMKRSTQINKSFLEGQVIYPQANGRWHILLGVFTWAIRKWNFSISFTRSWWVCNVIEYSLWPSHLRMWQPPNHPLSYKEAKFPLSPKMHLLGLRINLGCLFLGNRRLRNFDLPHNGLKEFRQRDFLFTAWWPSG